MVSEPSACRKAVTRKPHAAIVADSKDGGCRLIFAAWLPCAYPVIARYTGHSNGEQGENFVCAKPDGGQ